VAEDGKGAMRRNRCVLGPPNWKASDCARASPPLSPWCAACGGEVRRGTGVGTQRGLLPLGSSAPNHPLADLWTQSTRAGGQWSGRAWYVAAHRGADATSRPIRARYVGGERLRWPPFFFKPEIRPPLTEAEAPHEAGAAVSLIGRTHLRICHRARTSEI
jgi:hypothetical protein